MPTKVPTPGPATVSSADESLPGDVSPEVMAAAPLLEAGVEHDDEPAGAARSTGDAFEEVPLDALTELRDRLLLAALPNVAFDGWTLAALRQGAETEGLSAAEAAAAFPGGVSELVEHFSAWADRQMLARLAKADLASMKVRDRITLAVRSRMEALAPHVEAVRRSVAYLALPQNAALGTRILYRTVDAMWYAAGDTSTDYNFYTKRLLLAGVQSSTILYWVNDRSEGHRDTWHFLDRRIADVMRIGKGIGQLKDLLPFGAGMLSRMPSPGRFARHFGRGGTR
ncbi:MAG TPA: COQ9 family protein [Azospirillaceae bacterium]|nr:COQ9 family protein [Azospirillaceae bacterium]